MSVTSDAKVPATRERNLDLDSVMASSGVVKVACVAGAERWGGGGEKLFARAEGAGGRESCRPSNPILYITMLNVN